MNKHSLNHTGNAESRADEMFKIIASNKLQHKIINSAPDFYSLQDLFINSMREWLYHPKCKIALDSKGEYTLDNSGDYNG